MQTGNVTTPFGRRPMSLAMLANQTKAGNIDVAKATDKWRLYRALCEARLRLGVTDRAMALLNALLSFYPHTELSVENGLIVFPSNAQLSLRAHGMAEQTIRRHLAGLIDAGLLTRKDSANGKRYARRDGAGDVNEAFGFSLAPLLARAEEIEAIASQVVAERVEFQRLKERLTICRRDVSKLIMTALDEQAPGDWQAMHLHFRALVDALPRSPSMHQVAETLDEMELLREEVVNRLEMQIKSENHSVNPLQNERHIQNSKPESISELEPRFDTKLGRDQHVKTTDAPEAPDVIVNEYPGGEGRSDPEPMRRRWREPQDGAAAAAGRSFPLGMVLQACPDIAMYAPGGAIDGWRDLMGAAVVVRSMLGVSPSAYQEACEVLGAENAATVMACILERAGHINSAGGYLRTLTERARKGEFGLGPMLMASLKANGGNARKAG
ncbi:replication initiation protein RepC [Rhizobium sp. KVB221]|uniref:Replication initiation protein RepC n=1 Tax=Rhizobium setariae TaxID=2801340 RepID=A0A937CQT1_9HYPH|nr:plasmid replication protein RepC [Rhizobium setariae]MBL0373402.1 replication initiation protein RepC [Rhizobium setariae]